MTDDDIKELEEIKRQVIKDAHKKRLTCSQVCENFSSCLMYKRHHITPESCRYFYECEANRRYWSKRLKK